MSIDNLESVDVVTADGQLRHASAKENPDLFWGVRGGGGNFGIVTNFEFRLHPMQREVIAGSVTFPIARARDVLGMYAEYAATAPDELYMDPALILPPGGGPGSSRWTSAIPAAGESGTALAPLRKLGTPDSDSSRLRITSTCNAAATPAMRAPSARTSKADSSRRYPDKLVSAIVDSFQGDPNRTTVLFFQHCGGAASRRPKTPRRSLNATPSPT